MLIFPPLYKMREGEEGYRGAQCLGLRALQRHGFAGTLPRGFDHRDLLDYRSDSDVFDSRTGTPSIIDMRGVKLPTKKHDCESFEFSRVKQIAAGHLREDLAQNYLAAWVGDEIYVYLIRGVSNAGMLDKKLWVIKAPQGFKGFETDQGLTYETETATAVLTLK